MKKHYQLNGEDVVLDDLQLESVRDFDGHTSQLLSYNLNGHVMNYEICLHDSIHGMLYKVDAEGPKHQVGEFQVLPGMGGKGLVINYAGIIWRCDELVTNKRKKVDLGDAPIISPMPGKILKILVEQGESVAKGQPLLILEAMKMEHTLKAPRAGVVAAILKAQGDSIDGGIILVKLEPADEGA